MRCLLTFDERTAIGGLDVAQCPGGVAYQRNRLIGGKEKFDQLDRVPILGDIPQRAVAAGKNTVSKSS